MKAFIVLVMLLFSSLQASDIMLINDGFTYAKASPFISYVTEEKHPYTRDSLLEAPWQKMTSTNLGGLNSYASWTMFRIKNISSKTQNLVLKNPRANMDEVDVYLYKQGHLVDYYVLGDNRSIQNRPIAHRYSIVPLVLKSGDEITIISRLVNRISSTEGEWEVYQHSVFSEFSMLESMWWGFYSGLFVSLLFYLSILSMIMNDKPLVLLFSLYVFSTLGYQLATNGILYSFGLSAQYVNFTTLLFGSLFGLFTIAVVLRFLKISQYHGIIQVILRLFAANLLVQIGLLLVSLFYGNFIHIAAYMSIYVALFAYIVWLVLLKGFLSISQKGIFRYMFLGYTSIIVAYAYQALTIVGLIDVTFLTTYAVSMGSIVEMYFFALAIRVHMQHIQEKQKSQSHLIDYQMRFTSIGKVIGNISHQWKLPLVRLGALITHIESIVYEKNPKVIEVKELIPQMRIHCDFMQHAIDEFYYLYTQKSEKKAFSLAKVIHDIWGMLSAKAIASNVVMMLKEETPVTLESYEHSFAHVMIVLMDNVIDIAKKRSVANPHVLISIAEHWNHLKICVEDNCGGIEQNPIDCIFEIHVTGKTCLDKKGGIGLAIAKTLVCEKLSGQISVSNTALGSKFCIVLPK